MEQVNAAAKCRPVEHEDRETINAWYAMRGFHPIGEHLFPDVGYIVPGIGAGFIYQTDSSLCFIEGYISNPTSTKAERKEAFDAITVSLIHAAKDHGFTSMLAYTKHEEIAKRCDRFQFQRQGDYTLYRRSL